MTAAENHGRAARAVWRRLFKRLHQSAANGDADRGDQDPKRKRYAPAPGAQARLGQRQRQHEANQAAQQAAEVLARELPTRKQHAPISRRGLEQKHGRGPHLAADRKSLKEARDNQEDRRQDANRLVAGRERDDAAADGHQPNGEGHRRLAPGAVAVSADEGAAKRPRDEADAEGGGRRQIAHQHIVRRKERLANHAQERGVDRKVEEFEPVAEDRRENASGFERWPGKSGCGIRPCGQTSLLRSRRASVSGPKAPCQRQESGQRMGDAGRSQAGSSAYQ